MATGGIVSGRQILPEGGIPHFQERFLTRRVVKVEDRRPSIIIQTLREEIPRIIAVHLLPIEIRVTRIVLRRVVVPPVVILLRLILLRREEVERLPGEVAVADVVDADK